VFCLEPAQLGFGIDPVNVDDENTRGDAGRDADVGFWKLPPPLKATSRRLHAFRPEASGCVMSSA
jgi:hypothetical protein